MTTPTAGRYDILKGLERAFQERGHKYALDATLGHLADQYIKDMEAVRVLLEHAKADLKENGGCDHSVGICACALIDAVEKVARIFPLGSYYDKSAASPR